MKHQRFTAIMRAFRTPPGLLAGLTAILTGLLLTPVAKADLNMTLVLERTSGEFRGRAYMFAYNTSIPVTYHRVESPSGIIYMNTDWSESSSPNLSYSALLNECTNGLWTVTLNEGDVSEEQYAFSVSITGVSSNLFGDSTITNPLDNATTSTNQPLIEWTSTSLLPEINIQVHDGFTGSLPGNYLDMVAPVNSWTPVSSVPEGYNYINLTYQSNDVSGITITVPTNLVGGAVLPNWNSATKLESSDSSSFIAPAGAGSPLGEAVEAPELDWITGGEYDWFSQSDESNDSIDAAQSGGPLSPDGDSWIETTVQGPGTLSFYWNMLADYGDYFECSYSNEYDEDLELYAQGYESGSWEYHEIYLAPGDNTIRWTFYNSDYDDYDYNAAFLDEVTYAPEREAYIELEFQRTLNGNTSTFYLFPSVQYSSSPAEIESPNGLCSGSDNSSSSANFSSLQAAIAECEAGNWTISFDGGQPYQFTATVNSLTTNDIPVIDITTPADGASGVSPSTDFAWSGTTNYSTTFVSVALIGASTNSGSESLSGTATNWSTGPIMNTGSNRLYVTQTLNSFPGVVISDPGLSTWSAETRLTTRATSEFIVGGIMPLPVTILSPVLMGGDLGFSFLSQSGATHIVEWSTNLVTGPWLLATNFPGDGTTNMVTLPTTNSAAFYRIETE